MFYSIDRFENNFAILIDDNEDQKIVSRSELPPGAEPGGMLRFEGGCYIFDAEETLRCREEIRALQGLLKKGE